MYVLIISQRFYKSFTYILIGHVLNNICFANMFCMDGCADWSAPLFFICKKVMFFLDNANIVTLTMGIRLKLL